MRKIAWFDSLLFILLIFYIFALPIMIFRNYYIGRKMENEISTFLYQAIAQQYKTTTPTPTAPPPS
jgi:hypothetical protein